MIFYIFFCFIRVFSFNATILQFFVVISTVSLIVFLFLDLFNFKGTKAVNETRVKEKSYPLYMKMIF
ncbi:MAG: hypothetical protein MR938_01250 [Tenericutes bacterium]|nr:hypothetical protein [Mycoplasmatota bacterium]